MKRLAILTVAAAAILASSMTAEAATLIDNFNNGLAASRWQVAQIDASSAPWTLTTPDIAGGISISKPADTDPTTTYLNMSVKSKFSLVGDLSAWVNFDLHTFPGGTASWNEAGLSVGNFLVLRFTQGTDQYVEGYSGTTGLPYGGVIDSTMTGRLGITRQGQTMGAWLDRGSGPVLIGSLTDSRLAGPVEMSLFVSQVPAGNRPHTALDVSFDNLSITADSIAGVATQWVGNGHVYQVVTHSTPLTWDEAKLEAESMGGHLATITSAEENAFAWSLVDDDPRYVAANELGWWGVWIGGSQPPGSPEPAGNWQWVTGEPFAFDDWGAGQPDNHLHSPAGESRLCFSSDAKWNDFPANAAMQYYLVEYEVPEPASLTLLALGGLALLRRKRRARA